MYPPAVRGQAFGVFSMVVLAAPVVGVRCNSIGYVETGYAMLAFVLMFSVIRTDVALQPVIGGSIASAAGWQYVYIFSLAYSGIVLLLVLGFFRESLPREYRLYVVLHHFLRRLFRDAFSCSPIFVSSRCCNSCKVGRVTRSRGRPFGSFSTIASP